MIRLETIAPLGGSAPEGAVKAHRKFPRAASAPRKPSRRTILGGALAVGTGIGMAALGIFPPVRRAMANGYTISIGCPSNYAGTCSPGCGPSPVCADCCTPPAEGVWHKHATYYPGYFLRPKECTPTSDGWTWSVPEPGCGGCTYGVTWRCHDGWKLIGTTWYRTICRAGWCH